MEIAESEADLKKRLHHAREAIHKEKLQMLWWVKSGQIQQQQEIGQRLGRDTSTITRWLQKYRRGGLQELLKINQAPLAKRILTDFEILPFSLVKVRFLHHDLDPLNPLPITDRSSHYCLKPSHAMGNIVVAPVRVDPL